MDEGDSAVIHHNFIQSALEVLVPTLLQQLLKQEDDQDREDTAWNLSMAAGTCLDLIATVVEDKIIPLVMPFVQVPLPNPACQEHPRPDMLFEAEIRAELQGLHEQ